MTGMTLLTKVCSQTLWDMLADTIVLLVLVHTLLLDIHLINILRNHIQIHLTLFLLEDIHLLNIHIHLLAPGLGATPLLGIQPLAPGPGVILTPHLRPLYILPLIPGLGFTSLLRILPLALEEGTHHHLHQLLIPVPRLHIIQEMDRIWEQCWPEELRQL